MPIADGLPPDPIETAPQSGYYGVPVIHGANWKWLVVCYFFFGGISGTSAVIAAFARLAGGASGASVARTATYVSLAALAPCPVLLILDLGRPRRFLNMLRVFRPTSPMSVGSWVLMVFCIVSALTVLYQLRLDMGEDSGHTPSGGGSWQERSLAALSATTGFLLAGYTGVLLAATAVPLWSKRPGLLGPLFLASAMTSGAAAVTGAVASSSDKDDFGLDSLHNLEFSATIAEGTLLACWLVRLGSTGKPLTEGQLGAVVRHGVVGAGMVLPLALTAAAQHLPPRLRRPFTVAASFLSLLGVFALRYAVVEGGRRSADDPQATFELTG